MPWLKRSKQTIHFRNTLVDLAGIALVTLLITFLFGCGTTPNPILTAHNERGPLSMVTKQTTIWIVGDDLVTNWRNRGVIPYWSFFPNTGTVVSETSSDVANRLNHYLLGTPTGDPSDLPQASPIPPPDVIIIMTGTFDVIDYVKENEPDHGPCQGTPGDTTSPQIPTGACEAFYSMCTQAHQAGAKILLGTIPLATTAYQGYTPALNVNESRFNAYLKTQGLTQFGADGILDLSAGLSDKWTNDGITLSALGANELTQVVSAYISQTTSLARK